MSTQSSAERAAVPRLKLARARMRARAAWRMLSSPFSSSLTRRIVFLNLGGLVVLVLGFLWLIQFRADIIGARVQSLRTQASVVAAAVAASSSLDAGTITVNPEDLLQAAAAPPAKPSLSEESAIEFSINPERVGPMLHRLVTPTRTRALVYDRDGLLLLDSRGLQMRGAPLRLDASGAAGDGQGWPEKAWRLLSRPFAGRKRVAADDPAIANGLAVPEVVDALAGRTSSAARANAFGDTIISVTTPIQRLSTISGALVLSTQGGEIDDGIAAERWALLRFFLVLAAVMLILSLSLANTIAAPVRKLAAAAERVGRGVKSRRQIPDFTDRHDEIGHLSHTLRDMTQALYSRMDAIESFAADVAHELKNPLTSLRSAVEVLPRINAGASRARLLEVIQHDVRRLDRLISDISDASRLDAELARGDSAPVDLAAVVDAVVEVFAGSPRGNGCKIALTCLPNRGAGFMAYGHDSRLAQVVTNLVDNACSFSEPGGEVRIELSRVQRAAAGHARPAGARVLLSVADDGPGVPAHALDRIFERFYTDRPNQGFGQNSGLGLSISRQIVEAHGGTIIAENRPPAPGAVDAEGEPRASAGARFVVTLPAYAA